MHALFHRLDLADGARSMLALMGFAVLAADAQAATPFPPEFDLETLLEANGGDGSLGFAIRGVDSDGSYVPSGAGDFNADGIGDIVLGALNAAVNGDDENAGRAYVVFGVSSYPAEIDLSDLLAAQGGNGSEGLVIDGRWGGYGGELVGAAVSMAGDVDHDGFDDVLVGAPWIEYRGGAAGEAYLVMGTSDDLPAEIEMGDPLAGTLIRGCASHLGDSVSRAGDFNGDRIDDFLIGAPGDWPYYSDDSPGEAVLVFGTPDGLPDEFDPCDLANGDGTGGALLIGIDVDPPEDDGGDDAGRSVGGGGDVNGDGFDDIIIGAPGGGPSDPLDVGAAYLFFGRGSGLSGREYLEDLLPENGGDGSEGAILKGPDTAKQSGASVAMIGDFNGDGLADVAVSGHADVSGDENESAVFVVFGRSSGFPPILELATLLPQNGGDGSAGVVFYASASDSSVFGPGAAGDVNRDGIADLIMPASDGTYVIYGSEGPWPAAFDVQALRPENGGDGTQGFVLSCGTVLGPAGDVNADGIDDLIASCLDDDPGRTGITYVLFGRDGPFDTDGDGIADPQDNCSQVGNPDQRDTDGDGIGSLCDADFNNDCVVNFVDLGVMKRAFFTSYPEADLNGDGTVNFMDLGLLKAGFFLPPGPSGRNDVCDQPSRGAGSTMSPTGL